MFYCKLYEMRMAGIDIIISFYRSGFLSGFERKTLGSLWRESYAIAAFLCVSLLKHKTFAEECSKCCFAGFAFDVDFLLLRCTELQFQFLSQTQNELHYFFISTIFHKNPRLIFDKIKEQYQPQQNQKIRMKNNSS